MNESHSSRKIAGRFAWILPLFGLAGLVVVLWIQNRDLGGQVSDLSRQSQSLRASTEQIDAQRAALASERDGLRSQVTALTADNRQMASRLAVERAMPRGSLGDFFLAYEQFAGALRFEVLFQLEYRVRWRLEEPVPGHTGRQTVAWGKPDLSQGVFLGLRSNFAFGLVVLPDLSPALFVPGADRGFRPPGRELVEERWYWKDKQLGYVLDEPPIERMVHVKVSAWGSKRLDRPVPARVLRLWREPDKGHSVLVIGLATDDAGIDPGPPFVDEPAWMASIDRLGVFMMTAPNDGIVLRKEHLAEAYRADRDRLPDANPAWDFYRAGWLRSSWDGIPGRIEVLFAPLAPGEQQTLAPMIHSLVFPMIGRRAFWIPFWSLRERLLAPGEADLASLPAFNVETRLLGYRLERLPARAVGEWEPGAFQTALYDLLKRRPTAP
jgi:hypothetical protein